MVRALLIALGMPLTALYIGVIVLTMDINSPKGQYALIIPVAYLLGSIPWGFLLTQTLVGKDIRHYGSGSTGTANVLRTAGSKLAIIVLLLDVSKGALSVALAKAVAGTEGAMVAGGLASLAGHNWPIFLSFKGGRGVATGLGAMLVMHPMAIAIAATVYIPVIFVSRYSSLGSLTGVASAFIATLILALVDFASYTLLLYTGPGGTAIFWLHRDNIRRLRRGTEPRMWKPVSRPNSQDHKRE